MELTTVRGALILSLALVVPGAVAAQPGPPVIHRVMLQPDTGVLTILGTGLDADLLVTLEGQPISVLPGATARQIEALVPAPILAAPGTYRLTVADSMRGTGDGFVVAIAPGGGLVTNAAAADPTPAVAARTESGRVPGAAGVDRVESEICLGQRGTKSCRGPHQYCCRHQRSR